MEKPTIKVKILKTLLESPKTTGNVAIALGYKDDKGRGIYKNVQPDLNTLTQYKFIHTIETNIKTVGAPATTYDINYDISILREVLLKYPSIVPDLQKNERIVSMVADKQNLFVERPLYSSELETVIKMLTLSKSFFKNYVLNPNFLKTFCDLWLDDNGEEMEEDGITLDYKAGTEYERIISDDEKWIFNRETSPIDDMLINAFEHSTITDRINNEYNPEALDFLKTTFRHGFISLYPVLKETPKSRPELLKEFRKKNPRYVLKYTLIKV
jgi:hypothetical protein